MKEIRPSNQPHSSTGLSRASHACLLTGGQRSHDVWLRTETSNTAQGLAKAQVFSVPALCVTPGKVLTSGPRLTHPEERGDAMGN